MKKTTVKLNASLCDRARKIVEKAGYSGLEEFLETSESKEELVRKLQGLGYLK
jgi:hypothetical protein